MHGYDLILTLTGGLRGPRARLPHAAPRPVADRRLSAGRHAGRPAHARLRRRRRARRAARRDRRHPADVRRRPAVPHRRAAGGPRASRFPGAIAQSAVATLLGALLARGFGWDWSAGLVFGMALSVASTVVLIRVLADNNDLHTPAGHIAVGWLVVEDLFTVAGAGAAAGALRRRAADETPLWLALAVDRVKVGGAGRVHGARRHAGHPAAARPRRATRNRASCSR